MDLTEAEDIKRRWQEYTEELYKKDLHNPDNHDGVITNLETEIPDHLTRLLRNLYAGQETTVRTGHGIDWFHVGKGVCQGCILSPCL